MKIQKITIVITQAAWMQYGGNWNGFDVGLTADVSTTDGHAPFIDEDKQTQQDQSLGTDVSLAPGLSHMVIRIQICDCP